MVEDRLVDAITDSHAGLLGRLPKAIVEHFIRGKLDHLAGDAANTQTCELRLQVPNLSYEFDGLGLTDQDQKPRKIDGKYYLITFASYRPGEQKPWSGLHVVGKKQALKVDRDRKGVLPDEEFCRMALPTKAMLKEGKGLAHPIWVARIKSTDEGKRVSSKRWRLLDEVAGLEQGILE